MKPDKVLCCKFLFAFLALTMQKQNSCLLRTEDLTNRNVLVTQGSKLKKLLSRHLATKW